VPANGVLLTALDAPVAGSTMTCTTMPGGRFDPSRTTSTASATAIAAKCYLAQTPNTDSVGELLPVPDGSCLRAQYRTLGVRWAGCPCCAVPAGSLNRGGMRCLGLGPL
jgi:hypothetical protein